MKRILLTTVSLGVLALGTPALAADLPLKARPAPVTVYDWSGVYVGGFGGYGFGNQNLNNALGPAGFAPFTTNWETHGAFGGALSSIARQIEAASALRPSCSAARPRK